MYVQNLAWAAGSSVKGSERTGAVGSSGKGSRKHVTVGCPEGAMIGAGDGTTVGGAVQPEHVLVQCAATNGLLVQ